MPAFSHPETGTFCWVELQTTDTAAARAFYAALFDWTIADLPGGFPYGVASVAGGQLTAGFVDLPPAARARHAPPNWLSYVAVDDVAATVKVATELGGTVLLAPTTMGPGTLAVLQDPTGAAVAVWHTTESMGTSLYGELGACGWNELGTNDVAAARRFYERLFGWSTHAVPMPNLEYYVFRKGMRDVGGLMALPKHAPGLPCYWGVYFVVADADRAFSHALSMGATVSAPLMDVPTVGRFGFLADPEGAVFAVIRLEPRAA